MLILKIFLHMFLLRISNRLSQVFTGVLKNEVFLDMQEVQV